MMNRGESPNVRTDTTFRAVDESGDESGGASGGSSVVE